MLAQETATRRIDIPIDRLDVSAYDIPTDAPESDGTLEWTKTTVVVVEVSGGGRTGLGYTYANAATARLVAGELRDIVCGANAFAVPTVWTAMVRAIRNTGRPGVASMAIAAVDIALWDLKARLVDLPLVTLLGARREGVAVYGSGGFTSYSRERLEQQLGEWVASGIPRVKMKIGRNPVADLDRIAAARRAIGPSTELYVDANGAYDRKQALGFAEAAVRLGVSWFEEPVPSDDLGGLRFLRDHVPFGLEIAAGEYGYDLPYFRRLLAAGAVDVVQADATRCAGITGFLAVASLCDAFGIPLSAHTAPSVHCHPGCAAPRLRHVEYFHDHVRIEQMLFDGAAVAVNGALHPDHSRPGLGLELKRADASRFSL